MTNLSAIIAPTNVVTTTGTQTLSNKTLTSPTITGDATINAQGDLRFADADSSNYVALQAPATVASNVTFTLPSADGTASQFLQTNGSGTLSFATVGSGDLVLVQTSSFSGVANTSTTFDGVFTSSFKSYRVVVRQFFGSNTGNVPTLNLRVGGSTNSGSQYNYYYTKITSAGATAVVSGGAGTNWTMPTPWVSIGSASCYWMDFTGVGVSSQEILSSFSGLGNGNDSWLTGGLRWEGSAITPDGFILTASTGTLTGTIDVYGYK